MKSQVVVIITLISMSLCIIYNHGFCCTVDATSGCLHLKEGHLYYAQVQGQMGVGGRAWCDFVVYMKKGISVESI